MRRAVLVVEYDLPDQPFTPPDWEWLLKDSGEIINPRVEVQEDKAWP